MIRHFTAITNIKDREVIDPKQVKHGDITALKISNLSGWVDPRTHLNLDFPKHLMREVFLAENLDIGGRVLLENERFMTACVNPLSYGHFGCVDEAERSEQLREAAFQR